MAHHKSAKKRIRLTARKSLAARQIRSHLRSLEKSLGVLIKDSPQAGGVAKKLDQFYSGMDKAVQKGIFHRNRARRKKSQMALLFSTQKPPSASPS